jgi:hypothetical protein
VVTQKLIDDSNIQKLENPQGTGHILPSYQSNMQAARQAAFAKSIGPYHAVALPFVRATDDQADWTRPQHTKAYTCFRKHGGSIFMTHLRWDIGGIKEVIRSAQYSTFG